MAKPNGSKPQFIRELLVNIERIENESVNVINKLIEDIDKRNTSPDEKDRQKSPLESCKNSIHGFFDLLRPSLENLRLSSIEKVIVQAKSTEKLLEENRLLNIKNTIKKIREILEKNRDQFLK